MTKHQSAFWNQMYSYGSIQSKQFSLCFINERHATREGSPAGIMTLGGSDTQLHKAPMVYAQELGSSSKGGKDLNYHVHIEKLLLKTTKNSSHPSLKEVIIDEYKMNNKFRGAMVDSGTTVTYFSKDMKKPFQKSWRDLMGFDYGGSSIPKTLKIDQLPTIVLQLRGTSGHNSSILVEIPPANYISETTDRRNLEVQVHLGSGKTVTLGANFLSGYDVLFDIDNHRIGFAPSDCHLPKTTTSITDSSSSTVTYASSLGLVNASTHAAGSSNPIQKSNATDKIVEVSLSPNSNISSAPTPGDTNTTNSKAEKEIQGNTSHPFYDATIAQEKPSPKVKHHYTTLPPLVVEQGNDDNTSSTNITTTKNVDSSTLSSNQVKRSPISVLLLCYILFVFVYVVRRLHWHDSPVDSQIHPDGGNRGISARETLPLI